MRDFFRKKSISKLLQYALYMLIVLVFQNMLFSNIRPLGVCCMFLPAAGVAVAMFEGTTYGAVFALILGIFADMAYVENSYMFTMLFPAIAFFAGFMCQFFVNRRFFAFMFLSAAALLVTAAVQAVSVLIVSGFSFSIIWTALLQTLWSIPVSALCYPAPAKWIN